MSVILNNAHYRVERRFDLDSCGGGNVKGHVIEVTRKTSGKQGTVRIPLNVWKKIVRSVEGVARG